MKITDRAKEQLKPMLAQHNVSSLRVYIAGMGWGGPQLGMVLDEPKKEDVVKEINGITVCFEEMAETYAEYTTLDAENGQFMLTNQYSNC